MRDEVLEMLSKKVDLAPFEERFGLSINNLTVAQVFPFVCVCVGGG